MLVIVPEVRNILRRYGKNMLSRPGQIIFQMLMSINMLSLRDIMTHRILRLMIGIAEIDFQVSG